MGPEQGYIWFSHSLAKEIAVNQPGNPGAFLGEPSATYLRPQEEKQSGVCFRSTNFPIRSASQMSPPPCVVPSQLEVGKGE